MITLLILGYLLLAFVLSLCTFHRGGPLEGYNSLYIKEGEPYWKRYAMGLKVPIVYVVAVSVGVGLMLLGLQLAMLAVKGAVWIYLNMP